MKVGEERLQMFGGKAWRGETGEFGGRAAMRDQRIWRKNWARIDCRRDPRGEIAESERKADQERIHASMCVPVAFKFVKKIEGIWYAFTMPSGYLQICWVFSVCRDVGRVGGGKEVRIRGRRRLVGV